jgi:nicotinamide phosphoribosyltransferase
MNILRDKSILDNILLRTDSYKASHFLQLPEGINYVHSYVESRGGENEEVLFFGLQYYLKEYLSKPFTQKDIDQAEVFWKLHGEPFNKEGFERILKVYGGYFPIKIRAAKEGSLIPVKNVLMTLESTDPESCWIVGYLETLLLKVWYPITVATRSYHCKKIIKSFLDKTSDSPDQEIPFKLHCFGYRGCVAEEAAGIGNAGHLVNFLGSDTVRGALFANIYYGVEGDMASFSIPAMEHFTVNAFGRENESKAYENMLNKFANPGALLAVVSDSYDLWNAIANIWGKELKQKVIDSGATIILRPDSGPVVETVCKSLNLIEEAFGSTLNSKGYKVLNYVRLIQGDGINPESLKEILEAITNLGFSTTNIAFGMGGGLLQQLDRDTQKFAMKCSAVKVGDELRDVNKDPITDPGKKSKAGQLELIRRNGEYKTVKRQEVFPTDSLELQTVFENGKILIDYTFDEVRANSRL